MNKTRERVTPLDVAKAMAAMAPDLPMIAREAPGLLLRRPSDKLSLGLIFQRAAHKHPERPFLLGPDRAVTYGEANELVNQFAHVYADHGVQRGDVVGIKAKNDVDTLLLILAAAKLGAVAGLLNYNQRGDVLAHSLQILDSRLLVHGDDLEEELRTAGDIVERQQPMAVSQLKKLAARAPRTDPEVTEQIQAKERLFYIFTSGTTGMPKASIMSNFRWLKSYSGLGALGVRLKSDDILYCALPLYHNNAVTVALGSVLVGGAAMAIAPKFSASGFWDDCINYGATAFIYIGELCQYLLHQPSRPVDRQHQVRVIVGNGLRADIWTEFKERFGIERIAEFYGASECNIAFINAYNIDQTAGTCPLPYKVVDYDTDTGEALRNDKGRLVGVKVGEIGLLLAKVTDRSPFDGYTEDDATEAKLLRDGFKDGDCWFNTGDLVRHQGLQHVAFVDRLGDTFRWKGENVATTQVEGALNHLDHVDDCSVYGVEVPGAGGRAGMAAIVTNEGYDLAGLDVAHHIAERLPSYAWPLFLREVDSLEHTSTFKSRKVELKAAGFTDVGDDPVYVLTDREHGYVPYYEEYVRDVVSGKYPKL